MRALSCDLSEEIWIAIPRCWCVSRTSLPARHVHLFKGSTFSASAGLPGPIFKFARGCTPYDTQSHLGKSIVQHPSCTTCICSDATRDVQGAESLNLPFCDTRDTVTTEATKSERMPDLMLLRKSRAALMCTGWSTCAKVLVEGIDGHGPAGGGQVGVQRLDVHQQASRNHSPPGIQGTRRRSASLPWIALSTECRGWRRNGANQLSLETTVFKPEHTSMAMKDKNKRDMRSSQTHRLHTA